MILPPMSESIPEYILAVFENWSELDPAVTEFIDDAIILLSASDSEYASEFIRLVNSQDTEIEVREYALSCLEAILGRDDPVYVAAKHEWLLQLSLGSRILNRLSEFNEQIFDRLM